MNKSLIYTIIGIVVVVAIAIGIYAAVNHGTASAPSGGNDTTQTTPANTVTIDNFAFEPATITVNEGSTVTWKNNDSAVHRVAADDGSFDLGNQANGSSVKFTFTKTGTFSYHCTLHPSMKGVIIVK